MDKAENMVLLHKGGYTEQARRAANNECAWMVEDTRAGTAVLGFADGSAVYISDNEFRPATQAELNDCLGVGK